MTEQSEESKQEEQTQPESEENTLAEQLAACQEKYVRLLAESENVRKRMQKERGEMTQYAVENVLVEFLHPLDNFQNALKFAESMSEEVKNWAIGFEMILSQLRQVLANHGVQEYQTVGERFDPHMHEAVEMVESDDHEPGFVVEECLRGYKIGDRPIRVARVKVSKEKEGEKDEQ